MIDPRNWRFVNPQNKQIMAGPVLDMAALDQPPDPFFRLVPGVPAGGPHLVQIRSFDSPFFPAMTLMANGFPNNANALNQLSHIAFTLNFTLFLTWEMPAGAGPVGGPAPTRNVIYTLGTTTGLIKSPSAAVISPVAGSMAKSPAQSSVSTKVTLPPLADIDAVLKMDAIFERDAWDAVPASRPRWRRTGALRAT